MSTKFNRVNIFTSLFWKLIERGGVQFIQLFIQIILARLLSPSEFGLMAIILVFINLSRVFVDNGLSISLIQKKRPTNLDYSTVLTLSFFVSSILYILLFLFSPIIADFYNMPLLRKMLPVAGIIIFLSSFNSVQMAFVSKKLLFKKSAFSSLVSTLISGTIGVILALNNMGVWSLLIQQITHTIFHIVILNFQIKWRPGIKYSKKSAKNLLGYGSKILASSLIYRIYLELRTLIIGRYYSSSTLAFYQRGEQIPKVLVNNIDGAIQQVLLPVLSDYQTEASTIKSIVRRSLKTSSFVIFPIMFGIASMSESIIFLLLGEQWLPTTPFLIIFSLTYAIWPILTINQQPARALGKSDIILRTEIIKRIIGILIILVTVHRGVIAIAIGFFMERIVEIVINSIPNYKLINYKLSDQVKDIFPSFISALIMGLLVYSINFFDIHIFLKIIIQVLVGIIVYLLITILIKNDSLYYLINLTKKRNEK